MVNHVRCRPGERKAMVVAMVDGTINTDWCLLWNKAHADWMAHEVCKLAYGPKPTISHEVAHSCNNGSCINRHHIRWATREGNMADRKKSRNFKTLTINFK